MPQQSPTARPRKTRWRARSRRPASRARATTAPTATRVSSPPPQQGGHKHKGFLRHLDPFTFPWSGWLTWLRGPAGAPSFAPVPQALSGAPPARVLKRSGSFSWLNKAILAEVGTASPPAPPPPLPLFFLHSFPLPPNSAAHATQEAGRHLSSAPSIWIPAGWKGHPHGGIAAPGSCRHCCRRGGGRG